MHTIATRESWLEAAVAALQTHVFDQAELVIPAVKVSCSWPGGGSPHKRMGECWAKSSSRAKVNEIFISPKLAQAEDVLATLVHELVHAVDDCKHGHKTAFVKMARAVGLEGKPSQTTASAALLQVFREELVPTLGVYPHAALDMSAKRKAPRSAFIKFDCSDCGMAFRVTAGHAEQVKCCPACQGEELVPSA